MKGRECGSITKHIKFFNVVMHISPKCFARFLKIKRFPAAAEHVVVVVVVVVVVFIH